MRHMTNLLFHYHMDLICSVRVDKHWSCIQHYRTPIKQLLKSKTTVNGGTHIWGEQGGTSIQGGFCRIWLYYRFIWMQQWLLTLRKTNQWRSQLIMSSSTFFFELESVNKFIIKTCNRFQQLHYKKLWMRLIQQPCLLFLQPLLMMSLLHPLALVK